MLVGTGFRLRIIDGLNSIHVDTHAVPRVGEDITVIGKCRGTVHHVHHTYNEHGDPWIIEVDLRP